MQKLAKFIISIIIPFITAAIGSFFTSSAVMTWYTTLQRPSFSPPNWIFAPVWTILYLMMGIALYFVWAEGWDKKPVKIAMTVFFIQLALNALWSIIFFGLHLPFYAFVEIIFLWFSIYLTMLLFSNVSRKAAYLLVPYILWVSFAVVLNYYIFMLNI